MVITLGWGFIDAANHTPFIPEATTHINKEGIEHAYPTAREGDPHV